MRNAMEVEVRHSKKAAAGEWQSPPLGEVFNPDRPRVAPSESPKLPFIGMEHVEAHTMKLLGTVPAGTMKSSSVHFQPGDVLYGRLRPYLNKVYRPDFEGLCSAEFIVFPQTEGIDNRFLQYFLNSNDFVTFASRLNEGDRPRVDFKQISPYPFPLFPLPQQRRIVAAIELQLGRLDAAVARLHAAKAKLKRYKQAVLKAAVDEAIDNGEMIPLGNLITTIGQGWSPKCLNTPSPDHETWGVIKTTAIQPGAFGQDENKELPSPLKPRPEHELQSGDLLVTRAGPRSRVGITCLVRETRPRLMNCDKAYRLRFDAKRVDPAYIEMLLNSPQITDQLDELKTGISDSGVNLTQGRFLILEMPVIGVKEQRAMMLGTQEATASIDEMESTLDAQLAHSTRLRQSVLKRAFEGRLTTNDAEA